MLSPKTDFRKHKVSIIKKKQENKTDIEGNMQSNTNTGKCKYENFKMKKMKNEVLNF